MQSILAQRHFIYEAREKVRTSFGDNYQRLRELKAKFDPANLFRGNANIPPG
jgi:FAD/FMN-containing dehydrogenase